MDVKEIEVGKTYRGLEQWPTRQVIEISLDVGVRSKITQLNASGGISHCISHWGITAFAQWAEEVVPENDQEPRFDAETLEHMRDCSSQYDSTCQRLTGELLETRAQLNVALEALKSMQASRDKWQSLADQWEAQAESALARWREVATMQTNSKAAASTDISETFTFIGGDGYRATIPKADAERRYGMYVRENARLKRVVIAAEDLLRWIEDNIPGPDGPITARLRAALAQTSEATDG